MKAMIWKELRENLKWAILAMIGLGLAEIYGLNYVDPNNYRDGGLTTLCKSTFLMATTFGYALTGFFLGLVQILPELRRDQWATLLHRPVTRGVILRGKVVAGLFLYLIATVPPFLVCIWLVATPGHYPTPFVPGTILAGIADLCAGAVYYFAALFLALHRGPWLGARILSLFAAVHLSFYVIDTSDETENYFHLIIAATVLMGLVLFTAAWGAMLSNGSYRARPWLGKLALLIAVFYGLCGLGDVIKIVVSVGGQDQRGNNGPQYKLTLEGVPLIADRYLSPDKLTDLDGHVIDDPRYLGRHADLNLLDPMQVAHFIGDPHGLDLSKRFPRYRGIYTYLDYLDFRSNEPPTTLWYYLPQAKYLEGIDNRTKKPVQIVDRMGFRPWSTKPDPFQGDDRTTFSSLTGENCLLNEGKIVHVIDLLHEKVFTLSSPDGAWIFHASLVSARTANPEERDFFIALVTAKDLFVYTLDGKLFATLPFHHDVSEYGTIGLAMNPARDHFIVQYGGSRWIDWDVRHLMTSYVEVVDDHGNVINSYVLPPLPIGAPERTWVYYAYQMSQTPFFWYGTVAYQSLCSTLGIGHYDDRGVNPFYPEWSHPPEVGRRLLLVSLVWVPIAIFLARRAHFSWGRTWAWALFVYLFNIAGLLTFWLAADWPARVKCPSCSRKRLIEETTCPHCHAPWPVHKPDGIEIFEPQSPTLQPVS